MKTAEERIPTNSEFPLTEKEMEVLLQFIDQEECKTYDRFVRRLSGGYCYGEVIEYDDRKIIINIIWGVDGDWNNHDELTVNREFLSTPEKILQSYDH